MRIQHVFASLALFSWGCGGADTRPEAMSAPDHDEAAERTENEARLRDLPPIETDVGRVSMPRFGSQAGLLAHAEAHRAAARTLRANEALVCEAVAEPDRAVCPLMEPGIVDVEYRDDGVAVTYTNIESGELERRVRCHHAYGARVGREGMDGCPLYQRDLAIEVVPSPDGAAVVLHLTSDDRDVARRLHAIYGGSPQ
ncbi:MAG: hypothetical protein H6704_27930 [Myxococcales bacterium]|nr:hypothetical protein [Myxococcales bacterium]